MSFLTGLDGNLAVVILCSLLLIEEAGVPVPLLPGDLILVVGGVLIATGSMSPWVFGPLAGLATVGGALIGHQWSGLVGEVGLRRLAAWFGATQHLESAARRVRATGPRGIMICRLIPGLRINTTLVAGALGIERRAFVLGLVPAAVIWIGTFTALGAVVGTPVVDLLHRVDRLTLRAATLAVILIAAYLVARHVPGRRGPQAMVPDAVTWWRVGVAVVIDLGVSATISLGCVAFAPMLPGPTGVIASLDGVTLILVVAVLYLAVMRVTGTVTAGEALGGTTYRPSSCTRTFPLFSADEETEWARPEC